MVAIPKFPAYVSLQTVITGIKYLIHTIHYHRLRPAPRMQDSAEVNATALKCDNGRHWAVRGIITRRQLDKKTDPLVPVASQSTAGECCPQRVTCPRLFSCSSWSDSDSEQLSTWLRRRRSSSSSGITLWYQAMFLINARLIPSPHGTHVRSAQLPVDLKNSIFIALVLFILVKCFWGAKNAGKLRLAGWLVS